MELSIILNEIIWFEKLATEKYIFELLVLKIGKKIMRNYPSIYEKEYHKIY